MGGWGILCVFGECIGLMSSRKACNCAVTLSSVLG